jgi:hypothetical protein
MKKNEGARARALLPFLRSFVHSMQLLWGPAVYRTMGGHSAWRKRVAAGGLMKGSGGAALRHHPRLGRRGDDMILNRKGHIAGGNPKRKKKTKQEISHEGEVEDEKMQSWMTMGCFFALYVMLGILLLWKIFG